jgi:hypothetical protein
LAHQARMPTNPKIGCGPAREQTGGCQRAWLDRT